MAGTDLVADMDLVVDMDLEEGTLVGHSLVDRMEVGHNPVVEGIFDLVDPVNWRLFVQVSLELLSLVVEVHMEVVGPWHPFLSS